MPSSQQLLLHRLWFSSSPALTGLPGHTLSLALLTHTGEVEYRIGQGQVLVAGVVGYLNLQRDMHSVTCGQACGTWWAGTRPSATSVPISAVSFKPLGSLTTTPGHICKVGAICPGSTGTWIPVLPTAPRA